MNLICDVELNEDWESKRGPLLKEVLDFVLPCFLMPLALFTTAISLSIKTGVSYSLIVNLIALPISFVAILAVWFPGMITLGLLGQFHAVNAIFTLFGFPEFRTSQLLMIVFLIPAKALYMALKDGNMTYQMKIGVLIISGFLICSNTVILTSFYMMKDRFYQAGFVHLFEFILFLYVMCYQFINSK